MTAPPILTCDDWTDWVTAPEYKPTKFLSEAEFAQLEPIEQKRELARRRAHNAREVTVINATITRIFEQIERRHLLNQNMDPRARTGFVITGKPRTGKTTVLQTFGKRFEADLREDFPERFVDEGGGRYTPVVYLSLPQSANEKTISKAFAEYLNVPYMRGDNEQDITRKVLRSLREMGAEMLLLDEIHNLAGLGQGAAGKKRGQSANDYLKNFCNHSGATPVFAGVDLEESGLFSEFHGARITQTAGRFTTLQLNPYAIKDAEGLKSWRELIFAMERPIRLHRQERGDLVSLARFLHDRSDGYVATVSQLIREAAVLAIDTGRERIDQELLEQVRTDKRSADAYEHLQRVAATATAKQARSAKRQVG